MKNPSKPNILIFQCDQLRPHALACYGNPLVQTPHIDALAAKGLRYETAIKINIIEFFISRNLRGSSIIVT